MALQFVNKLRALAVEADNRPHIVKNQGFLTGLAAFLSNPDEEVVFVTVEVLSMLASYPGNLAPLSAEPGLMEGVKRQMFSGSERTKKLAMDLYVKLQNDSKTTKQQQAESRTPQTIGSCGFFSEQVSGKLQTAKVVILYIKGLTSEEARAKVEQALVSVKGVVSFMIDIYEQKATIRTMTTIEALTKAIRDHSGLIALPPSAVEKQEDKENAEPDYLPENIDGEVSKSSIVTMDDPSLQKKATPGVGLLGRLSGWWYGGR